MSINTSSEYRFKNDSSWASLDHLTTLELVISVAAWSLTLTLDGGGQCGAEKPLKRQKV